MRPLRPGLSRSSSRRACAVDGSRRCCAHAAAPSSQPGPHDVSKQVKAHALPMPADVRRNGSGASPPGNTEGPGNGWDITRRTALVGAVGAGALWLADALPLGPADRAIEKSPLAMPLGLAEDACVDAASVCSTVHSQMSSTLRQLSAGFLTDDLFQATCRRRLSSPYFAEVLSALPDAVPALGNHVAYQPDLSGFGRLYSALGKPVIDQARRERIEQLTLTVLQRSRRALRLSTAMANVKYTPAGVQLLVQDLRFLNSALNQLVAEKAKLGVQL